jgi:hypothetical protein
MHQQFNIQQLYALPTMYLCVLYLSEDKQRFVTLQHKLIGFYNRDEKCLLRGAPRGSKLRAINTNIYNMIMVY